jgi:hypothetical protein
MSTSSRAEKQGERAKCALTTSRASPAQRSA